MNNAPGCSNIETHLATVDVLDRLLAEEEVDVVAVVQSLDKVRG